MLGLLGPGFFTAESAEDAKSNIPVPDLGDLRDLRGEIPGADNL